MFFFFLGVEFLFPTRAYYCSLCDELCDNEVLIELHLRSVSHNQKYQVNTIFSFLLVDFDKFYLHFIGLDGSVKNRQFLVIHDSRITTFFLHFCTFFLIFCLFILKKKKKLATK